MMTNTSPENVARARAEAAETKLTACEAREERLRAALQSVLDACDQGRMVEKGIGGMTIEAQIRRSVYTGVPAWPIEEARAALADQLLQEQKEVGIQIAERDALAARLADVSRENEINRAMSEDNYQKLQAAEAQNAKMWATLVFLRANYDCADVVNAALQEKPHE